MARRFHKADFNELVELAASSSNHAHMRPVIQKELLHYDILYSLDTEGLLDRLTFQGGTSLRLCHGAPRYSEDLDFVGGQDFNRHQLGSLKDCIESFIGRRYGLEVSVTEPKGLKHDREKDGLNIQKWQISVTTDPGRRDVPRQRIKIEVANLDAYSREPKAMRLNYDFLPEGYGDTLVLTESLHEILADKLVSLVGSNSYVRNRDIWDLHWIKRKGAEARIDWVKMKVCDYGIDNYPGKLDQMLERLPEIIEGEVIRRELKRFIPSDLFERTMNRPKFRQYLLAEITELLKSAGKSWE